MRATIAAGVATPAEPVPHGVLQRFAPALQPDLRHARLHRDPSAHAFARMIGARAFAHGGDIVLGQQASDLQGAAGRHAVAHELAHVVQQAPWQGSAGTPATLFSMQTYHKAMQSTPEPDWATAAEHLNGESPELIKKVLKQLSPHQRVKLHEAAITRPGLCSNIGRMTEAEYVKQHPDARRAADFCQQPAVAPQAEPATPAVPAPPSTELTDKDTNTCSPLYLQKLCVYLIGGFNGDRSGVPSVEDLEHYNQTCRTESGYAGPDLEVSDADRLALKAPKCARGGTDAARQHALETRLAAVLSRSVKYMPGGGGEQLLALLNDSVFRASLGAAVGLYLGLWLFPEPVFTKIAAAATTIAVLATGVFTISTLINLAEAWDDLEKQSEAATSDALIEAAAEQFGRRMGAITVDLLVFLASLLIGGKLPTPKGLPNGAAAFAKAEQLVVQAAEGQVVSQGAWGSLHSIAPPAEPVSIPRASSGPSAGRAATALKYSPEAAPVRHLRLVESAPAAAEPAPLNNLYHLPKPKVSPALAPEVQPAPTSLRRARVPPLLPGVLPRTSAGIQPGTSPRSQPRIGPRPPFVLWLPLQKAPHLSLYRSWLGALQFDPGYERGNPGQRGKWHRALRMGGSHAIPADVYERGHSLGLTGARGEARLRIPNWSRTSSVTMQVDHIIELQVSPPAMRSEFNEPDNFELLDSNANQLSGGQMQRRTEAEVAQQIAHDPSLAGRVLFFDEVRQDTGVRGERWSIDAIRAGRQLDFYENDHAP